MTKVTIFGYSDRLSVRAGETIRCMVSAEATDSVRAQLVRLVHGDEHPDGPGFVEIPVDATINRDWPVTRQFVQKGSFLRVPDVGGKLAFAGAFTLHGFVFATLPSGGRQAILSRWAADRSTGYFFGTDDAERLMLRVGDGTDMDEIVAAAPLVPQVWYFVAASFDPATGQARLYQEAVVNRYNSLLSNLLPFDYASHVAATLRARPGNEPDTDFLIAGAGDRNAERGAFVTHCWNGKIDRCGLHDRVLAPAELDAIRSGGPPAADGLVARWDPTIGYTDTGIGDTVFDSGSHALHATGVNRPVRGQTGWNWQGRNDCFRLAPDEYGGIEFHADALTDCHWTPTLEYPVPDGLRSGVYGIKLTAGGAEEYLPFFVRPRRPQAALCLLIPTASYLAYANGQGSFEGSAMQAVTAVTPMLSDVDVEVYGNDVAFGLSTYDHHNDGAGVCYSSYRRPIVNMRPKYRMPGIGAVWQFPADLSIVAWLEHHGYEYDVLTDEDLHREGVSALAPYRAVINGTHCEYASERMLDAVEDYLAGGGRLTYLSGNGYYWVVGFREDEPWVMEVRKLEAGSRAWQARAGEHYLACTGERSGLWRHRNRAPQKLVGTGFTSEGMDVSVPFRRMPDSYDMRASWIFEGVSGEVFGDFGLARGGAAGLEVDRYDLTLGTPPHALLLATSEPFPDTYPLVQEDVFFMHPGMGGTQHPLVRADIVFFDTAHNGAVFSASSIAWASALPCRGFDNDISRIMKNVVDAFIQPGPLPASAGIDTVGRVLSPAITPPLPRREGSG